MLSISESVEFIDRAEIALRCPHCHASNATHAMRYRTVSKLYFFLTVWVTEETTVQCPACGTTLRTSLTIDELRQLPAEALSRELRIQVGFIPRCLVTIAWCVFWLFPVSTLLFAIARFLIPKAAVGWRKAASFGLIASLLALPLFFVLTALLGLLGRIF